MQHNQLRMNGQEEKPILNCLTKEIDSCDCDNCDCTDHKNCDCDDCQCCC